ncbi:MAG: serine/threonine protein kinase [Nannocystaceae bacterium]|nr:serine/threonine protein kinase [Nannocystaceae bacterium]
MHSVGEATLRPRVLAPGTTMGRYTIVRRIGSGGMAELYLVRARGIGGFDKLFALKLVLPHVADDPDFVGMFLDEARLAATLDHPNIAHVVDIGRVGDDHFYAMEYVHGRDLRAIVRAAPPGPLPLPVALSIVMPAAAGLHHAHERRGPDGAPQQLVHRDVSPSNLLVTYDGVVKLVDFGIARAEARSKATQAGVVKGKRGYMSPEQCRGDAVDRRSDVFGLGTLLWELTVGQRLFVGDNDYAVMSKIVFGMVPDPRQLVPGYPDALAEIVMRALQRDPSGRQDTAEALALELEAFVHASHLRAGHHVLADFMRGLFGDEPYPTFGGARTPEIDEEAPTRMAARPARRRPPVAAAVLAAVLLLAATAGGIAIALREPAAAAEVDAAAANATAVESAPVAASEAPAPAPAAAPTPVSPAAAAASVAAIEPASIGTDADADTTGDDQDVAVALVPETPPRRARARGKSRSDVAAPAAGKTGDAVARPAADDPGAPMPKRPNALFPPTE